MPYDPSAASKVASTIRGMIDYLASHIENERKESQKYTDLGKAMLQSVVELKQSGFPVNELPDPDIVMRLADKLANAQDAEIKALQDIGRMLEKLNMDIPRWKDVEQAKYNRDVRHLTPELARQLGVPLPSPAMLGNEDVYKPNYELRRQLLTFIKGHNGASADYMASYLNIPHISTVLAELANLERAGEVYKQKIGGQFHWYSKGFRESEESKAYHFNPNDIGVFTNH